MARVQLPLFNAVYMVYYAKTDCVQS